MLHLLGKYLYASNCPQDELYKHVQVEKEYGSMYSDYTENNYFFDLLDLGRRLLLTGALIMVGSQSNTQIFLGALLCLIWLLVVAVRRPYKAYWDNVLSIVLSLQLVLIMLCGMALEMNRLTPEGSVDAYEETSFGILMVVFSVVIIFTAVVAIVVSIPCVRDPLVKCWVKHVGSKKVKVEKELVIEVEATEMESSSDGDDYSVGSGGDMEIEMTNIVVQI